MVAPENEPINEVALQAEVVELRDANIQLLEKNDTLASANDRLATALRELHDQAQSLKEEIDRAAKPPNTFGVVVRADNEAGIFEVVSGGRKLEVTAFPSVVEKAGELAVGAEVKLNESLNIVDAREGEDVGDVVTVNQVLDDGRRVLISGRGDEDSVAYLTDAMIKNPPKAGDSIIWNARAGVAYEVVPKTEVEEIVLEEVPDISYEDVGGLSKQIVQIRDAVELPFLNVELFKEHELKPPKGVLLYGPPGCGKTLIAKAVANSLAKAVAEKTGKDDGKAFFLNIKGPELLNKYVGETERHIRLVFQRAREKASEGQPVIVFFDEMESLFRTRGSGVSSDVENSIVPQLLSEIDGVESLENVIVIGASNRPDMIDPAILRPGRLDVKIKVERPDAEAAVDIFSKYLTPNLPLREDELEAFEGSAETMVQEMIKRTVEKMYLEVDENKFIEITYANGDKETTYFKDFNSGAMIQNIVDRAKKSAIKDFLENGKKGLSMGHLQNAIIEEFQENEDLPNTTNPDDWARISGKKGERIVFIRTLHTERGKEDTTGRAIDNLVSTGQYL